MKLRRKDLAREYGIDVRTVDRWKADGTLPRPRNLKRPYWTPEQIVKAEMIQMRRWTREEKKRAEKAARLLKHRIQEKIKSGKLIVNQLAFVFK